jgi:phosphomannomutase/phosphoglucomutase
MLQRRTKIGSPLAAPAQARAPRSASLPLLALPAFVGIALVLGVACGLALYAWAASLDTGRVQELQSCGSILARNVAGRVSTLRQRIDSWARDPRVRETLRTGDPNALRATAQQLARAMPQAREIRLLPAGYGTTSVKDTVLSYAGLDLVQQAEQQRRMSLLEVHRLGAADVHLAVAAPVLDDAGNAALGVLHVSLPLSWLPKLGAEAAAGGRLAFQQQVNKVAVTIDPRRGTAVPDPVPDVVEPIPNTRLRVAGWVKPYGIFSSSAWLYASIAYAVVLAAMGAVLWLALGLVRRALAADFGTIVALVERPASGRPSERPVCRLKETAPVVEVVSRLLSAVRSREPTRLSKAEAGKAARDQAAPSDSTGTPVATEPAGAAKASSGGRPRPDGQSAEPVRSAPAAAAGSISKVAPSTVPSAIFRGYDIRGIVDRDLTPELMRAIGLAVGSAAAEAQPVFVARDTRPSGAALSEALLQGVLASGSDAIDLGIGPTPLLYFAASYQGLASGAMVTGSHNPPHYNGVKVVVGGRSLEGDDIRGLRDRILQGRFTQGEGQRSERDVVATYIDRVEKDVAVAYTMKVVVDCGNGAAAALAPRVYRNLGCEVVLLDCDPAAGFPESRVPDPTRPEFLAALQRRVVEEKADLGLAFDADGDRLGVVDSSGKIIWTDRLLMLLAADVLSRHPGADVVFDVKCTHHLATQILRNGGRPIMWRSGHSPLKAKLRETGAMIAGEWSGHIIFRERWYGFDDAIYAGARLLEVLALDPRPSAEVFAALPEAVSTPEYLVPLAEGEARQIMESVLSHADSLDGFAVQTIDGLRADSDRAWGLVRASNTQPALVFRFEGDDEAALGQIQDLFRRLMGRAAPEIELPF